MIIGGVEFTLAQLCALQVEGRTLDLRDLRVRAAQPGVSQRVRSRGRGIDYVESRVYQPGDDIRSMDWRVTARSGRPHTKLYQQENARQVYLLVDFGASMFFGTRRAFKSVAAAETAALLCWAAVQRGARMGALINNATRIVHVRDRDGRRGALAILQALVSLGNARGPEPTVTPLSATLRRARHVFRPDALMIVISDFAALAGDAEQELARLGQKHQLLLIQVYDPLEASPPPPGHYAITDGRDATVIDTRSASLRTDYESYFTGRRQRLETLAHRLGMALMSLCTNDVPAAALARRLGARAPRRVSRPAAGERSLV